MNRRQVLFGASATAIMFGGFVPWANAGGVGAASPSTLFPPFSLGIRGTYTLNGTATLLGLIPPLPLGGGSARGSLSLQGRIVQGSAESAPAVAAPVPQQDAPAISVAPARLPMMSIVPVPRGSKVRGDRVLE